MENRFVSSRAISSTYLNHQVPLGLFQAWDGSGPKEQFLIIDHAGVRHSIILNGNKSRGWSVWALNEAATAWHGLSMGSVEIELDVASAISTEATYAQLGDITIAPDGLFLGAQGPSVTDRRGIRIEEAGQVNVTGLGHVFRRWRLIQREYDGKPISLFERNPE